MFLGGVAVSHERGSPVGTDGSKSLELCFEGGDLGLDLRAFREFVLLLLARRHLPGVHLQRERILSELMKVDSTLKARKTILLIFEI